MHGKYLVFNWRVCIAYNKYSAAASMIIYSVQYKGYHIPPSPTPATGKEPVLWHHISAVSAILDFEQQISTRPSPHLFPTYWI